MEDPAGDAVAGPDLTVIEHKIPKNPWNTAKSEREEKILVNGDSVAGETLKYEEDEERRDKKEKGDKKSNQCEQVYRDVKI